MRAHDCISIILQQQRQQIGCFGGHSRNQCFCCRGLALSSEFADDHGAGSHQSRSDSFVDYIRHCGCQRGVYSCIFFFMLVLWQGAIGFSDSDSISLAQAVSVGTAIAGALVGTVGGTVAGAGAGGGAGGAGSGGSPGGTFALIGQVQVLL